MLARIYHSPGKKESIEFLAGPCLPMQLHPSAFFGSVYVHSYYLALLLPSLQNYFQNSATRSGRERERARARDRAIVRVRETVFSRARWTNKQKQNQNRRRRNKPSQAKPCEGIHTETESLCTSLPQDLNLLDRVKDKSHTANHSNLPESCEEDRVMFWCTFVLLHNSTRAITQTHIAPVCMQPR